MARFINDGDGPGGGPAPGGGAGSGGAPPAGGDAPAPPTPPVLSATGVRTASSDPTSFVVPVRVRVALRPVNAGGWQLDPDQYVEILPVGSEAGAAPTTDVFYSLSGPTAALNGPRVRLDKASSSPRVVTVRNLCEIWVYTATLGEGVELTVRSKA